MKAELVTGILQQIGDFDWGRGCVVYENKGQYTTERRIYADASKLRLLGGHLYATVDLEVIDGEVMSLEKVDGMRMGRSA